MEVPLPELPQPSHPPFEVCLDLTGLGCADITLRQGERTIGPLGFGYLTDGFGDLARAALAIATGQYKAALILDGEVRRWRITMQQAAEWDDTQQLLRLQVWTLAGDLALDESDPDTPPILSFEAVHEPDVMLTVIVRELERLWSQYGAEGFDRMWISHVAFPLRAMTALKTALSIAEPVSLKTREDREYDPETAPDRL